MFAGDDANTNSERHLSVIRWIRLYPEMTVHGFRGSGFRVQVKSEPLIREFCDLPCQCPSQREGKSARIKPFEDIEAWQLARELTRKVYGLTKKTKFDHDFGWHG